MLLGNLSCRRECHTALGQICDHLLAFGGSLTESIHQNLILTTRADFCVFQKANFNELFVSRFQKSFDVGGVILAAQAQVYQRIVSACQANSNCKALLTWGISDAYSWIPGAYPGYGAALLFDEQFQPKPAYEGVAQPLR